MKPLIVLSTVIGKKIECWKKMRCNGQGKYCLAVIISSCQLTPPGFVLTAHLTQKYTFPRTAQIQ